MTNSKIVYAHGCRLLVNISSARAIIIRIRHMIISPHDIWDPYQPAYLDSLIREFHNHASRRAKQKCVFEHAQYAQIQIHSAHAQSHPGICSPLIHSIRSNDCVWRIAKVLIRLRGCAGWSGPSLSAHARRHIFLARPVLYFVQHLNREWRSDRQ